MSTHISILKEKICESLSEPFLSLPKNSEPYWLIDCTLGGGGHTEALLSHLPPQHKILGIDQDLQAFEEASKKFQTEIKNQRLKLVHAKISELPPLIKDLPIIGVLADLGFSSDQLDDANRGFSFQKEGPLDMRMDTSRGETCSHFLSHVSLEELTKILFEYGEEKYSRRIALSVVRARDEDKTPKTTSELTALIVNAVPPYARHGRIHPATRSFQALRIYLNQELHELDCLLNHVIISLKTGGRAAIISFHSLEDRKVKWAFRNPELGFHILTKKPVEAEEEEIKKNPRARSAKLRIAERIAEKIK